MESTEQNTIIILCLINISVELTPIAKMCNANKRMTIAQKCGGGVSTGILDC